MTLKSKLLAGAAFAGCVSLSIWAAAEPSREDFGAQKTVLDIDRIEIENMQGERLGRIKEVAVDLSNGVIVEVLVVSGDFLGIGGKIAAVPPLAPSMDMGSQAYHLDTSTACSITPETGGQPDHGRPVVVEAAR